MDDLSWKRCASSMLSGGDKLSLEHGPVSICVGDNFKKGKLPLVDDTSSCSSTAAISATCTPPLTRKKPELSHVPATATTTTTSPTTAACRTYKRSELEMFNLLATQPIWVFDVERKAMWWANDAAVTLWSAPSRESLLSRDFTDMSQATCKRLDEFMVTFRKAERSADQVCPDTTEK